MFKAFTRVDLIGGKDNSLSHYSGLFNTVSVPVKVEHTHINATDIRRSVNQALDSPDFRRGVIYQINAEYPKVYATVDIVIFDQAEKNILLGRKPLEDKWRFPGGFSDPTDDCFETSAKREAHEEVGNIEFGPFSYIGSLKIDDWRYKKERHKIITNIFKTHYLWGAPKASDDLAEVKWFSIEELTKDYSTVLVGEHIKIWEKYLS